jgi:selenocysteine lyase/cysteine desulfurase
MPRRFMLPCDHLRALYEAGATTITLANLYHCHPATIARHLRRCGVVLRTGRFTAKPCDEALLRRMYLDERQPLARIAAALNVSVSTVGNWRRRLGIPPRRGR